MKQKRLLIITCILAVLISFAGCRKVQDVNHNKEVNDDIEVNDDKEDIVLDEDNQTADENNDTNNLDDVKQEAGTLDEEPYLQVVHCEEWVSLRSYPDTTADRITTVPLGSVVYDLGERDNGFCYVSFDGSNGYILEEYLVDFEDYYEADDYIVEGESVNPPFGYFREMSREELQAHDDDCENYLIGEYTLQVAKKYTEYGEVLKVGCFRGNDPLWGYVTGVPYVAELDATQAVPVEYGQEARVMIINTDRTICMLELFTGELLWEKENDNIGLGGSICYDVSQDGIVYCSGYYDDGPMAIDVNGNVLWRATPNDPDIYWPYDIEVLDNGDIEVTYAGGNTDENTVVVFDKNGNRK